MTIPNWDVDVISLKDGSTHPGANEVFNQLFDHLQQNISAEGTGVATQPTENISVIANKNAGQKNVRFIYDSKTDDINSLKVVINGVIRTVTLT